MMTNFSALCELIEDKLYDQLGSPGHEYRITYFNETAILYYDNEEKEFYVKEVLDMAGEEDYGYFDKGVGLRSWLMRPDPIGQVESELEKTIILLN